MVEGGCFCGAIRYQAGGVPFDETICHCAICRRTTGAPLVAWFSVPRAQFRFVRGIPTRFRSSANATRTFCPGCGTQLTFERDAPGDQVDITACSLDAPERMPPRDHIWTASRLPWIELADERPRFSQARIQP